MPLLDKVTKGGIIELEKGSKDGLPLLSGSKGSMDLIKIMRGGQLRGTRGSMMSRSGEMATSSSPSKN